MSRGSLVKPFRDMGSTTFGYVVLFCLLAASIEALSFVAGRILRDSAALFYSAPDTRDYGEYSLKRHKTLGWPDPASFGINGIDASGSRLIPNFREPGGACASLYGDSFTWSAEVPPEDAWSNKLSGYMRCRVANYGVGGYGTDQAYLRFMENLNDEASIVVLAHMSENVLRNVNQWRLLAYPGSSHKYGLKPRFIVDEAGHLQLIPLPVIPPGEISRFAANPGAYLKHEFFLPDGPSGRSTLKFPYSWSILRSLRDFRLTPLFRRIPKWAPFYDPAHPSGALQVTAEILTSFHRDAVTRGKRPIVSIIPGGPDLIYYKRTGRWDYDSLIESLAGKGIVALNTGPGILRYLGDREVCDLFADCNAHFNAAGYELLARVMRDEILRTGFTARAPSAGLEPLRGSPPQTRPPYARASHAPG